MNLSNNEERSSAEAGEERPRAKENFTQFHTRPTQSGIRVSQGLRGVRQVAKERREEQLTALLHHLDVNLLRESFLALKRDASPGVDGVTWEEYETDSKIGSPNCTVRFIVERIGRKPREEYIYRRPTDDNARWASRRWRTKSFNRPW